MERATDRDRRRKGQIRALENLVLANGLADLLDGDLEPDPPGPDADPDESPRRKGRARSAEPPRPPPERGPEAAKGAAPRRGERWLYKGLRACVRYVGETQFAEGVWLGLELPEGQGKNNGSMKGVAYFECAPGAGVFVPWPACAAHMERVQK